MWTSSSWAEGSSFLMLVPLSTADVGEHDTGMECSWYPASQPLSGALWGWCKFNVQLLSLQRQEAERHLLHYSGLWVRKMFLCGYTCCPVPWVRRCLSVPSVSGLGKARRAANILQTSLLWCLLFLGIKFYSSKAKIFKSHMVLLFALVNAFSLKVRITWCERNIVDFHFLLLRMPLLSTFLSCHPFLCVFVNNNKQ